MHDKIVLSNQSALRAKYGAAGLGKIEAAVKKLVSSDARRGLRTRLVYVDDAAQMKRYKHKPVASAADQRGAKGAVDAIYRAEDPEYLMILGSWDVVPHQGLTNPLLGKDNDDDGNVPSDLPYACDAPYSRDIAKFVGPTRVVGRLPDLTGSGDPRHLLALLATAAGYRPKPAKDYAGYFALSTRTWSVSTELSLDSVFGNASALRLAPPATPTKSAAQLAPLTHFINCHGALGDPFFYGENAAGAQPRSFGSEAIDGNVRAGTVASVECCYGAELYDAVVLSAPIPICQQYLRQGAFAYLGSTNIAYGPVDQNGAADLVTQYFLQAVLQGASAGRATLVARQRYTEQVAEMDPVDLKTLAQFCLLGDPSLTPVASQGPTALPKGVTAEEGARAQRKERRMNLKQTGHFLAHSKPTASTPSRASRKTPTVNKALVNIAAKAGMKDPPQFRAYTVKKPQLARAAARQAKDGGFATRYYVAVGVRKGMEPGSLGSKVAAVAKESGGRIVGYRIYLQR